jgi:hypothetical protein
MEEAMFAIMIERKRIPWSNMEELILHIETLPLPIDFVYDVGKLVEKYLLNEK